MPRTDPFQEHTDRYDRWFETYDYAYESELKALDRLVFSDTNGVEIGVGTGRFAAALGIETGIDPSDEMLQRAADRGIAAIKGVGEALSIAGETFETALVVTTICFVDDIQQVLTEARRILQPGGQLVVGYIDKDAPLGERYLRRKDDNPFYENATFVSTSELIETLETVGFGDFEFVQTMFHMPEELTEPDRVIEGHGEGSFVGIDARLQE